MYDLLIIKFQNSICNGCHDLAMLSLNVSDITLIAVKGVDYHCIIHGISKSEGNLFVRKLCA